MAMRVASVLRLDGLGVMLERYHLTADSAINMFTKC